MINSAVGSYGDLLYRGDELVVVRSLFGKLECNDWSLDVSEFEYLMFTSACLEPLTNKVFVTGKAHVGNSVVIISENFKTVIPGGQGNYPSQLAIVNGKLVCFVVLTLFQYGIFDISGNLLGMNDIPQQYRGTSQGIRFVENERVFWGDETLGGVFNGTLIREWMQRGSFTAGQGNNGGVAIVGNLVNYTYNPGGNTLFPRLAVKDNKISILYINNNTTFWDTLLEEDISNITPVPPVIESEVMIPAFEKPIWQAPFFSHSGQYGDTPLDKHVGNCIWLRTSDRSHNPGVLPLITAVDTGIQDADQNLTIAYWEGMGTIQELVGKVNSALSYPEKPVIAYLDGDGWPDFNPFTSDRVWPSIQAYRTANESLQQFNSRVTAIIEKVQKYNLPMVLTTRFDDYNGSQSINNILECMPLYDNWLRVYNFVGHMPFSDRRGNAISSNEPLWKWARAFQYAIPAQRPNRFDYWRPAGLTEQQILENKLGQSRTAIVLEKYLRDYILSFDSVPEPGPEPEPTEWPNLLPIVQQVRAKYPPLVNVDQCVAIINEVGKLAPPEYQFGLLKKEGGNHGTQAGTSIGCSVDWSVSRVLGKGTDCLVSTPSSTEGPETAEARPTWPSDGEPFDVNKWVEPK